MAPTDTDTRPSTAAVTGACVVVVDRQLRCVAVAGDLPVALERGADLRGALPPSQWDWWHDLCRRALGGATQEAEVPGEPVTVLAVPAPDGVALVLRRRTRRFAIGTDGATTCRVALVGSRPLVLDGLAAVLTRGADAAVTGRYATSAGLRDDPFRTTADVVLADVAGVAAPEELRAAAAGARVLLLAERPDAQVPHVLARRADGVAALAATPAELTAALRQVNRGEMVLPGGTIPRDAVAADPLAVLSPRQTQITRLAAAGRTNAEIAAALFVSVNTVKFHLRAVYSQLRVHSRVELALRLAHPHG